MQRYFQYLTLCILLISSTLFAQNQVQVQIIRPTANQNFEGTLSNLQELTDKFQGQIRQVSGNTRRRINLLATLENVSKTVIVRTRTSVPLELNGAIPLTVLGSDLPNFFDISTIETEGIDRNDFISGGFLPEGFYKLCVIVFDASIGDGFSSQLSNSAVGCVSLRAQFPEPPRLLSVAGIPVATNLVVPKEKTLFNIVWTPTIAVGTLVRYTVKMADMGDFELNPEVADIDPNIALQQDRQPTYEQTVTTTNVLIGNGGQMVVQLEEGHRYALQVQATTANGSGIKNEGKSQVTDFWFGNKPGGNLRKKLSSSISLSAYPSTGNMPFIGMPIVIKYDPYSNDYKRFDSELFIGGLAKFPRILGWSPNPLTAQRSNTGNDNLTEEDAQYIAISQGKDKSAYNSFFKKLNRGQSYAWNANVWISNTSDRDNNKKQTTTGTFTAGMGKALLKLPADKDTLKGGDIEFKYRTSEDPTLTDFQIEKALTIVQAQKGNIEGFELSVNEKAILEVSNKSTFDSIKFSEPLVIKKEFGATDDGASILGFVYKDQTKKFNITKPGTYFWRVRWMKKPDSEPTKKEEDYYSTSKVWQFTIEAKKDSMPPTPLASKCKCDVLPTLPTPNASELSRSDVVKVGHFIMDVTKAEDKGGKAYSGEGVIKNFTMFGRHPDLKVTFTGLKVNELNDTLRAFAGSAVTVKSGTELLNIADIALSQPLSLPIGFNFSVTGDRFFLEITEVEFKTQTATAKAHAGAFLPGRFSTQKYEVSGESCMVPSGFGGVTRLFLQEDIRNTSLPVDDDQFIIKGRGNAPNTDFATFVEFNCDSVRLQLACARRFARKNLVPEDATGKIVATGNVEAFAMVRMEYYATKVEVAGQPATVTSNNMIAGVTFNSPFQVVGNEGWGFKARDGYIDLSEMSNPPDMTFPEGYNFSSLSSEAKPDPRLLKNWTGIYVKDFDVRIPKDFTETPRSIALKDFIIDDTGFTVSIKGENVLTPDQSGWDFSIDLLSLNIVQTTTITGNMKGLIGLPMFDKGSNLVYNALISTNKVPIGSDTANIVMRISVPSDKDLQMSLWKGQMRLAPNSFVQLAIGRKNGKGTHLSGELNGFFGLLPGNKQLLGMNLKDVKFENFGFDTDSSTFFTHKTTFSLASPQHSAGGFPVTIDELRFVNKFEGGYVKPGLFIKGAIGLSDLGFGAELGMRVYGKLKLNGVRVVERGFGGVELDEIKIDKEFNSFGMAGSLKFYDDDPTFGSGFRGSLAVKMPMKIAGALTVQFGAKGDPATADHFRYWYIDGMIHLKVGVQIGALTINGFGGGAYYHMKIQNPNAMAPEAASLLAQKALKEPEKAPGSTIPSSGLVFVPDKNTYLGIRAGIVGSILNAETVFNMDVSLAAEFNSSGGLNTVTLNGNGYLLQDLDKRDNPPVRATVVILYDHQSEVLDGNLKVMVNFYDILYGSQPNKMAGEARLHVDKNQWYFYVGTTTERVGLKLKKGPLSADMNSYFMVGHGIPSELPPLPQFVSNLLNNSSGKRLENQLTSANRAGRSPALYQTGQGVAYGSSLDISNRFEYLVFYAQLRLVLGFDLNITKNPERVCANGIAPGHKGWYGQGQAYAGIEGSLGIHVDLWFVEGNFEIAKVGAAIAMVAKLPNPEYFAGRAALNYSILRGAVKGHCNFNIEFGENCVIANSNPLGDVKLITDMQPIGDQSPMVNVSTAFMFPMDTPFEVEEAKADNTVIVRRFQPFIKRYQLFKVQGSVKIPVQDVFQQIEQAGSVGLLKHTSALEANTNYFAEIEVGVNEMTSGTPRLMPNSEVKNVTFKTGERPQTLVDIVDAWPIQNQRFFLQNEGLEPAVALPSTDDVNFNPSPVGKKGYIKIGQQDYLFKGNNAARNSQVYGTVKYEAVFTPTDGASSTLRTSMKYFDNERAVEFDIPQLANSTTYRLDIVRTTSEGITASATAVTMTKSIETKTFDVVEKTGGTAMQGSKSTAEITRNKLGAEASGTAVPPILTLFSYQFRTSKYNNHREKFAGNLLLANVGTSGFVRTWQLTTDEAFETSDFANSEGNVYHNYGQTTPLIQTFLPDIQSGMANSHQKFGLYRALENQYVAKYPYNYIDNPPHPINPYYAKSGLLGPISSPSKSSGFDFGAIIGQFAENLQSQSVGVSSSGTLAVIKPTLIFNDITDRSLYRRYDIMAKKIYTVDYGFATATTPEYGDAVNTYRYILGTFGQQRIKFIYWVPTKAGSYSTAPIQYETTVRGGGN